ncbi:MAG: Isoleucyl-tRNA synthetase, partial [Acidobacteria bacterium]|nr:Isoleucyl-tRNA synthetase [Acidobacteriota bacterium]
FQSSLLVGTGIEGGAPYKQVVTCGFVLNEKGDKMSKSEGNALSPQDVIAQSGADILRMWVAMVDYTDDMPFGPQIMTRISDAYRKIRNTARILLANLTGFDPATDLVPMNELSAIDRWIVARANDVVERCRRAYEEYEFHHVYHRIVELCTVDLSALYVDITKDTMYCELPDSRERRSAQTAMYHVLRAVVGAMAPIVSFTADEIYEAMPGEKEKSVHLTDFPVIENASVTDGDSATWERLFRLREEVTKVLERARAAGQIGKSLEADVELHTNIPPSTLLGNVNVDLSTLFIVSHVDFKPSDDNLTDGIDVEALGRITIAVKPARGRKCGRCWKYREEVAVDGDLCGRCQSVLDKLAPREMPTA